MASSDFWQAQHRIPPAVTDDMAHAASLAARLEVFRAAWLLVYTAVPPDDLLVAWVRGAYKRRELCSGSSDDYDLCDHIDAAWSRACQEWRQVRCDKPTS